MKDDSFICYLDLLGIKDLARYSVPKYCLAMFQFTNELQSCSGKVHDILEYSRSNMKIHYFSDCAFIQCDDIEALFKYLMLLRTFLMNQDPPLLFTAAINIGTLIENNSSNNDPHEEKSSLSNFECSGVFFNSESACNVYVQQDRFKGVGIIIDKNAISLWKENFMSSFEGNRINKEDLKNRFHEKEKEYLSNVFFLQNVDKTNVSSYVDLKFEKDNLKDDIFELLVQRYYSAKIKNKKYGIYYLPLLANWINSEFDSLNGDFAKISNMIAYNALVNKKNVLINRLRNSSVYFDYLYYYFLNLLYINKVQDVDPKIILNIIEAMFSYSFYRKKIINLDNIPSCVISIESKEKLIVDYMDFILKKNNITNKADDE